MLFGTGETEPWNSGNFLTLVGCLLGVFVGDLVGAAEGLFVGFAVGCLLGFFVGDLVGLLVDRLATGAGVGAMILISAKL
jgi:uncharacterized protein YcfJ